MNQSTYKRLFNKMTDYSNCYFPITDFLNDIRDNTDKRFDKERAYKDIEKIFDMFMYYHDKVEKYQKIEDRIGCPLDVFFKALEKGVFNEGMQHFDIEHYYNDGNSFDVHYYRKETNGKDTHYIRMGGIHFKASDHKKTWWLKPDRSE